LNAGIKLLFIAQDFDVGMLPRIEGLKQNLDSVLARLIHTNTTVAIGPVQVNSACGPLLFKDFARSECFRKRRRVLLIRPDLPETTQRKSGVGTEINAALKKAGMRSDKKIF